MKKIIYSLRIMEKLVEKGHYPEYSMPNPKNPYYTCWVFSATESFKADLDAILGEGGRNER